MGRHSSGVERTRKRVIGGNFSDFLIKGRKCSSRRRGIRVMRVRVNRVKMTGKWVDIQWKLDLVRVSEEFELSGIYFIKRLHGFLETK